MKNHCQNRVGGDLGSRVDAGSLRRMRRTAAVLVGLATIAAAACGGDDDSADDSTPEMSLAPASAPADVTAPTVDTPEQPPTSLQVTELTPGTGPEAVEGNVVIVDYVGVVTASGEQFDTSYGKSPFPVRLGDGSVIAGWEQGLLGVQAGERLQLDIPSDLAYGDQDYGEIIKAGDALSFVIDVKGVIPPNDLADEPTADDFPLTEEHAEELITEDIVVGEGATAEAGMTAFVNYVMVRADNGVVLEDTWGEQGIGGGASATTTTVAAVDSSAPATAGEPSGSTTPASTEPTSSDPASSDPASSAEGLATPSSTEPGSTTPDATDPASGTASTEATATSEPTGTADPGTTTTTTVAVPPASAGVPDQMILVQGQRIPGFIDGVIGMKVGGRRLITVPYEEAYGEEGRPTMGLPAETDVMIFVQLVAAY